MTSISTVSSVDLKQLKAVSGRFAFSIVLWLVSVIATVRLSRCFNVVLIEERLQKIE